MYEEEEEEEEQQSEEEVEEEIRHELSFSDDELSISPSRGVRDRERLAREKELQILTRHSDTSSSIIGNTSISSSSPLLQISERQKNKADAYRMPDNSNPEKKLYDRLHEAVQLDYVNFGPEILSDPTKLADVVNKRWHEIFKRGHSIPLPENTIERVYPSVILLMMQCKPKLFEFGSNVRK